MTSETNYDEPKRRPGRPRKEADSGEATRTKILDVAQKLIQTRGYNGFSFRDIADDVGIRTASIHHYYPTKADLGVAVARRYRFEFGELLSDILTGKESVRDRLEAYAGLFRHVLQTDNRLCLCGALGAETVGLPDDVAAEVSVFFDESEAWLEGVFQGQGDGALELGQTYLALLEGAMMVARVQEDLSRFDSTVETFLDTLQAQA